MSTISPNPVTWFEIYVTDLQRAKTFYEAVFGYELKEEPTDGSFKAYRFPGQAPGFGAMGALMHHPMRQPSRQGNMIYFHCDDCQKRSALCAENGGRVHKEKWPIGEDGFIAIIEDTDGNVIGLHSFQ